MSKFNWWRRYKKQAPLQRKDAFKGKSFLLQQIEHGDFDPSDYLRQAYLEKEYMAKEHEKVSSTWKASKEALREKLHEITLKYNKRYNRLMEDFHDEEFRLLKKLKEKLTTEFGIDAWDEVLELDPDQDHVQFYHNYRKVAQHVAELEMN